MARWTAQGKQVTHLLCARGEAGIDAMDPSQAGRCPSRRSPTAPPRSGRTSSSSSTTANGAMEYGLPLRHDITRVVRRHRPEVVVSGTFDVRLVGGMTNRADHRAAGLATLDAARDVGNRWVLPELEPEGLEPWNGVRMVCLSGSANPDIRVDVTGEPLERGIAALAAHKGVH